MEAHRGAVRWTQDTITLSGNDGDPTNPRVHQEIETLRAAIRVAGLEELELDWGITASGGYFLEWEDHFSACELAE